MADVAKGIIDIEINTGNAAAQLKALQQQINAFTIAVNKNNKFQSSATAKYTTELQDLVNASRFFTAETVKMRTSAGALDATLRKGQATLGQFFNARFNRNSALFAETMGLAAERARTLQTQFIATTGASRGMQDALAIRPLAAFSSEMAVATQRSQILTSMFKQGTTQLINFGKNVQWAGRQLMVGFTLPLTVFGSTAGKTFMELERQAVAFKKVYGDIFTTPAELQGNMDAVMALGREYTKYGIAVKDTVGLAAQAAAAGARNKNLTDAVTQATRLATLGQMEQNQALDTTIALQSAFRLSGQELADTVNFLNMVENQTVVSLQDLAAAIPRVAPVIKGLGGDVKDMAVFLAAMQEGGVSAEQGANALKSGLGSLINPTKQAKEMLAGFNINLDAIVQRNRGDLMGTVMDFARALQTLDEFSRQQALEQVFGKFQYARLGALFENIVRDGSQASQVLDTMAFSSEQLRQTAEKELSVIEQSFGVQLTAAIEKFKLAIAPIGQLFVQLAIPVVNFLTKIVEGFNNLPDFSKKFIALATIITGLVIPAGTMFFGLLMNLSGTLAKLLQSIGIFSKGLMKGGVVGGIQAVTQSMKYMSLEEIDAAIAAKQLGSATMSANDAFRAQVGAAEGARVAVKNLSDTYGYLINRMAEAATLSKFTFAAPGTALQTAQARSRNIKGGFPRGFARGGQVPGTGNKDTVPAMLTPGEFVVTKDATRSIGTKFLERLNMGGVAGYENGGDAIENVRNLAKLTEEQNQRRGLGVNTQKLTKSQIKLFAPPKQLTHLGEESNFTIPQSLTEGERSIFNKVGKMAKEQEGFTAFLPSGINQNLRNGVGNGVKASDLLTYLKNTPASETFAPLDKVLSTKNKGPGSDRVQAALIRKLELMVKTGRGEELLFDRHVGPIYQRTIKKMYPDVYSILKNPMQWRTFTEPINKKLGIKGPSEIEKPERISNLRSKGFVVLNKGKKLTSTITKEEKDKFIKNLPKGNVGVYRDKSGKLNFLGRDGTIIGATYTGGTNLPPSLAKLRKFFVTKNDGGIMTGNQKNIPSLLTPGEFVVNKEAAARNRPFLDALNAGKVKNFQEGTRRERNQRFRNITGRTVGQARMGAIASRVGGGMGGAAFAGLLAGPALQASSNQAVSAIGKVITGASIAASAFQVLGPVLRVLATRLPFLTNPVGLVITAFMATAGILSVVVNKELKKVADAGAAMTRAMYGSTENIEAMAESFGRTTTRQRLAETRASRAGGGITAEAQQFSTQYMQSDAGKKLLADVEKVRAAGGDAALAIRNQVSKAVIAGAITPDEAEAIAKDIGLALNDQSLAINAVGKIAKLFGPNGELLEGNVLQIAAEISPKFNLSDIITQAQEQVKGGSFISRLFGIEENQVRENVANNITEILKGANENISASMDTLTAQYEAGEISFTKYQEGIKQQTDLINQNTAKAIDSFAQYLGKTDAELKNLYERNKFGNLRTEESKAVVKFFDDQRKAAEQSLVGVGQGFETSIVDAVFNGLADGDVLKATEYFNQLTTGNIDKDLVDKIVKALNDKGLIEAANAFRNYITPQVTSRPPDGVKPPVTVQEEDPLGPEGQKSKIQLLEESIKQTKEYSAALDVLVKRGLSPEAAASLDAATAIELVKKKRLDLVKAVNDQAAAQRVLQNMVKGKDERQVDILEAQTDAIDANIEAVQDQIEAINKLNDVDQRQITIRNKALEDLSKKEENINKSYNARIDALNRVKEANAQVAQQEKNRLDLASALTSGDIAAAAQAALTMTEDFAQGQIDNTQAELELQRQREIDALTTSVNGQLLTRQQIESQIDAINERMYQRDLQTWPLQDQIKNLESQREIIARQIEATQLRIRQRQIEEEARVGRLKGYYKDIAYWINQAAKKTYVQPANNGGVIGKAFGGLLRYTSNEPAPGMAMGGKMKKYAVGNIVPGLGNTDRVPALLTPGEFVVRKSVAAQNMDFLKALNGDVFPSVKGTGSSVELASVAPTSPTINNTPVYTYNVNVNVPNTDASPEEIANVVVGKLRRMTDTNLRSNRL